MQISIVGDLPKQSAENCDVHWKSSTQNTFCILTDVRGTRGAGGGGKKTLFAILKICIKKHFSVTSGANSPCPHPPLQFHWLNLLLGIILQRDPDHLLQMRVIPLKEL
jgi:hypothetical protein